MLDREEATQQRGDQASGRPVICEHCGRAGDWTEDGDRSDGSPVGRYRCLSCGHRQWLR